jgi:hypothetical protein
LEVGGREVGGREVGGREAEPGGRLDTAIDRTVREMLDVEPRADLRARVIARIEEPGASASLVASAFRRKAWLAIPLAAAAVLILAVTLSRRSEPPVQPTRLASADQNLPVDTQPQVPAPATPRTVTRAVSIPPNRPGNGRSGTIVAALLAGPDNATTDIEPLKTITPIQLAPIGERSIAPEAIAVRPLNPITDVQVAPLTPPDRRN